MVSRPAAERPKPPGACRSKAKAIVYAWVNDETTKRTYGSKRDAYAVFAAMLKDGNPPDHWEALMKACTTPAAKRRLRTIQERKL